MDKLWIVSGRRGVFLRSDIFGVIGFALVAILSKGSEKIKAETFLGKR